MRQSVIKKSLLLCASASILGVSAQSANAAFFAVREQSAYSQGASFAGAAAQTNALSSFFFNPAIITEFEGLTLEADISAIFPFTDVDTSVANANTGVPLVDGTRAAAFGGRSSTGNIGREALVPASYASYQFNEKVWFGLAVNSPFGLGTRSDPGSLEALSSQEFSALSVNFQPTVAYKFSERFSIAIGAQAQYIDVEQSTNTLAGGGTVNAELNATDWSFGVIVGATFKPTEKTTIGIGYRSQQDVNLDGDLVLRTGQNDPQIVPNAATGLTITPASADLALPDIVNLGISHKFTDRVTGLASFSWENWSRLQSVAVVTRPAAASPAGAGIFPTTAATFDFNLEDSFFYAIGGEFDATEHLKLRAGIAYETSPTNNQDRTAALPDNNRLWVSVGGSMKITERIEADFGATWIRVERDTPISNSFQSAATQSGAALGASAVTAPLVGAPIASGTADSNVFIFSFASRVRF